MPGPDKLAAKVRMSGCGGSVFRGLRTFYPSCHNLPGYVACDFLSCSCHRHLLVAYVCDWGRGGATWMPIDLPLEGSCFHLPAVYLPDYSMSGSHVLWEARLSSQCPQKLPGKGETQKGMGILSSRILQPEKHPLHVPCVHAF